MANNITTEELIKKFFVDNPQGFIWNDGWHEILEVEQNCNIIKVKFNNMFLASGTDTIEIKMLDYLTYIYNSINSQR